MDAAQPRRPVSSKLPYSGAHEGSLKDYLACEPAFGHPSERCYTESPGATNPDRRSPWQAVLVRAGDEAATLDPHPAARGLPARMGVSRRYGLWEKKVEALAARGHLNTLPVERLLG